VRPTANCKTQAPSRFILELYQVITNQSFIANNHQITEEFPDILKGPFLHYDSFHICARASTYSSLEVVLIL
jgi:hypothetical protein